MSMIALRAASEGPMGFSLASIWMPLLGSANLGSCAMARWDSVRMGRLASAEAPAAKRKKLRREIPVGASGSEAGYIGRTPLGGNGVGQRFAGNAAGYGPG